MHRIALLFLLAILAFVCGDFRAPLTSAPAERGSAPNDPPKAENPAPKAGELRAGVAKVEITNKKVFPLNDPLYVKALVLKSDATTAVLVTLDAVAVGEIGYVPNDYLATVRARLQKELDIPAASVIVNASHCHGVVCADVTEKTVEAVKAAAANLVPVKVGVGVGTEKWWVSVPSIRRSAFSAWTASTGGRSRWCTTSHATRSWESTATATLPIWSGSRRR